MAIVQGQKQSQIDVILLWNYTREGVIRHCLP